MLNIEPIDFAPYSSEYFEPRDRFLDIDIGVYDFVMKCIEGPFAGKFIHLNTSPLGEVIGGASEYDMTTNPERLTMYIENSGLIEKHVEIVFNSHCQYILKNYAGDKEERKNGP